MFVCAWFIPWDVQLCNTTNKWLFRSDKSILYSLTLFLNDLHQFSYNSWISMNTKALE